mmetsp:Transcript_84915/g.259273  ORF Transcript_84915/g.259273 Transcript_84915/m.259273 type:complete len:246 (-) Transcript_84915:860-1597(-)
MPRAQMASRQALLQPSKQCGPRARSATSTPWCRCCSVRPVASPACSEDARLRGSPSGRPVLPVLSARPGASRRIARTSTVANTKVAATSARRVMWCWKKMAETQTAIAWRVVAIKVNTTGPKFLIVYEIMNCVTVEEKESTHKCSEASGWFQKKWATAGKVPPPTSTATQAALATAAMPKVICSASTPGFAAKARSWRFGVSESNKTQPANSRTPIVVVPTMSLPCPSVSVPKTTSANVSTRNSA